MHVSVHHRRDRSQNRRGDFCPLVFYEDGPALSHDFAQTLTRDLSIHLIPPKGGDDEPRAFFYNI